MHGRWGTWVARRRWILLLAGLAVMVAGAWGTGVIPQLQTSGGFTDPSSESAAATRAIEDRLGRSASDVVVVYSSLNGSTVDDPAFAAQVRSTVAALPGSAVSDRFTAWSAPATSDSVPTADVPTAVVTTPDEAFVSADRTATFVALGLVGDTEGARAASYEAIAEDLLIPGFETLRGGAVPVGEAIAAQVEADIIRAESITLPILAVLLLLVLGTAPAAFLPWLVGGIAILGAFVALRLLSAVTDVSIFALNVVTILGLGLAVDYALLVVTRFREQLASGDSVPDALGTTMATAGRAVAFSGLTVAVSLSALLFFPQVFLRSMGMGSIAAVLVAMLAALVVLPAALAVLGHRVNRWRVRPHRQDSGDRWARFARAVMRRPGTVAVATAGVLLLLGLPFLRVEWGGIDTRALPAQTESRLATQALDADFTVQPGNVVDVFWSDPTPSPERLEALRSDLAALPGAAGAQVRGWDGGDAFHLAVTYDGDTITPESTALVHAAREITRPANTQLLVGGQAAEQVDLLASLGERLPWAAGFVVVVTLLLLFLAFGSVVLPVKAVLMTVLSLAAVLGVLVWGFQDGNLAGVLGFTTTGTIEATQPVLILAIAFGLSMDYEVFLLTRIREEVDATGDTADAVERGLASTGRIITSAALLLGVVMAGFTLSGISFIQMVGVGLVVGLLVDAVVVRALLVPATMRLLGRANWWAPAPLAAWWRRHGFREEPVHAPALTGEVLDPVPA
jgi:RND superfamily putative drug exporter